MEKILQFFTFEAIKIS